MPQLYTVLATSEQVRYEITVKKSRFLAVLQKVTSEQEALETLAELRKEFHTARHHCSAWVLGAERAIQRYSDDGEPAGTAGAPILETLLQHTTRKHSENESSVRDLSDICVVVIRWFGGTLLGTGGLVRAYSDSVSQALDQASFIQRKRLAIFTLNAPLNAAARWDNELRTRGLRVLSTKWLTDIAQITFAVDNTPTALEKVNLIISEITAGTLQAHNVGVHWFNSTA